ncbi:hypothetical protein F7725_000124 [Dissostichus mawsoni]|uniref:Reverse transcriptase zinc-binding domain-containing protein n=1 Tax=Dissostichus mawsoni TaxID=36200 RepID=A0A7J5ZFT9_DISMA|nr:hypothetical protein F7725_000124 [Dissostichus mawsoni]
MFNDIYPSNHFLHVRFNWDNNSCGFCEKDIETVEHMFFRCEPVQECWLMFQSCLQSKVIAFFLICLLPLLSRWKQCTVEARKKLVMMAATETEIPEKMTMSRPEVQTPYFQQHVALCGPYCRDIPPAQYLKERCENETKENPREWKLQYTTQQHLDKTVPQTQRLNKKETSEGVTEATITEGEHPSEAERGVKEHQSSISQLQSQGLPSRRSILREGRDSRTTTSRAERAFLCSSSSLKEVSPVKASLPTMCRYGLFPTRSLIRLLDSPNVPDEISVRLLLPKSKKTNLEEVLRVPGSSWERELFLRSR